MSTDKKSFVAVILCVIFYLAYTNYLKHKYPNMNEVKQAETTNGLNPAADQSATIPVPAANSTTAAVPAAAIAANTAESGIAALAPADLTIENKSSIFRFNQRNGGIDALILKDYRKEKTDKITPVNLVEGSFAIQGTTTITPQELTDGYAAERVGQSITFRKQLGSWEISQQFVIPENGFDATVNVSWKNLAETAADLNAGIAIFDTTRLGEAKTNSFIPGSPDARPMMISEASGTIERTDIEKFCHDAEMPTALNLTNASIKFFGTDNHYFQKVFLPEAKTLNISVSKVGPPTQDRCRMATVISQPQGLVAPGQSISMKFRTWLGPKSMDAMAAFAPELNDTVDLGWFGFIAKPLFRVTQLAEKLTGNWGWAIILVTILLKVLFFPLNRQAAVSMKKMNVLKPEMDRIREKFKDDKALQQQEIMKFMSANKINPMKGCLPILPQIPVFFAFYRILSTSIELRHAPFTLWIQDLSSADPYYVTPILLGAAQFLQQKLTPTPGMDKAQERMMMMLPIVFTVMMLSLPSGMVLYMLVNTIVSIGQQKWLNRRLA